MSIYIRFHKPKCIDSLAQQLKINAVLQNNKKALREQKILILDDMGFSMEPQLKCHGFTNIFQLDSIPNIEFVKDYSIVLCDLKGVGLNLDDRWQGAHVIKEIKKLYPNIGIIAYTAGAQDAVFFEAQKYADSFLSKTADVDEFIDCLDAQLEDINNPIIVWKKIRGLLIDQGIPLFDISLLEDAFVKSVQLNSAEKIDCALRRNISLQNISNLISTADSIINMWGTFTNA